MTISQPGVQGIDGLADQLAALYDQPFNGKERGRFRVSMKLLGQMLGRRRIWPDEVAALGRALYQRGYVCVDMESFIVILSQKTFTNYRRANEAAIDTVRAESGRLRA